MADTSTHQGATALTFFFPAYQLRHVTLDGDPWFVAADVLAALALDRKAMERLDDDEKGVSSIHTPGGAQQMAIVNESGLYSLILGSRKPEAKKFKRWVTGEVLPAIRRSGRYEHRAEPAVPALPAPELEQRLQAAERQIAKLSRSVIRTQSRLINAQARTLAVAARMEAREARQTIIEMERRGEPRERIAAITGRKFNHIRQVIFQARQAGVLPPAPVQTMAQAELDLAGTPSGEHSHA